MGRDQRLMMNVLLCVWALLISLCVGQIPDDAERALKHSRSNYNWVIVLMFVPGALVMIYVFLKNRKLRKQRQDACEDSPLLFTTEDMVIGEMNEQLSIQAQA